MAVADYLHVVVSIRGRKCIERCLIASEVGLMAVKSGRRYEMLRPSFKDGIGSELNEALVLVQLGVDVLG